MYYISYMKNKHTYKIPPPRPMFDRDEWVRRANTVTDIFVYNDGGRAEAGYKGRSGDCVTRAIAIATGLPYNTVYKDIHEYAKEHRDNKRDKVARRYQSGRSSTTARDGVHKVIYKKYLRDLGWKWKPLMGIGTGCTVHLHPDELPQVGTYILSLSRHLACYKNGQLHDTYDCSRNWTRCVYGYYYEDE